MHFFFAMALAAISAPAAADPIDEWAKSAMAEHSIPGMAVGTFCRGEPLRYGTYGLANLEHEVPVTLNTRFQSGSIGKQFTGALIQLLAREGKIDIDAPVSDYIDVSPEAWADMTIRHLLQHTAGLGDYGDSFDVRRDWSEEDLVQMIRESDLLFAPGSEWRYSNFGYILLGAVARKVTGEYWGDLAQRMIFDPVGMETAQVIDDVNIVPHRAAGYNERDGKIQNQWWASPTLNTTADGALYLTLTDLARWERALWNKSLLRPEELTAAWTPVETGETEDYGYGFGWFVATRGGRDYVYHGGSWQGFNSSISRDLTSGMTVVILANRDGLPIPDMTRALHVAVKTAYETQGAAACAH